MESEQLIFLDSSVRISCGRWESKRFQALAREARQRDTVFRISPGVYDERNTGPQIDVYPSTGAAVGRAIDNGWMDGGDQTRRPRFRTPIPDSKRRNTTTIQAKRNYGKGLYIYERIVCVYV